MGRAAADIVLPTHQILRPVGHQVEIPGRPADVLLLDGGKTLVVKGKKHLVFISTEDRVIRQTLTVPLNELSFHGIGATPDEKYVLVTGSHDTLWVAKREDGFARWDRPIHLPGPKGSGVSAPGGLWVKSDREVFVALSANNTLGVVDLHRWTLTREIPVGVAPYAVVPYHSFAVVSNWGGRHPQPGDATGVTAGTPVVVDPVTTIAASGTVSVVNLFTDKIIGTVEVGLHPCAMAVDESRNLLYVANANSDTVSVVDFAERKVVRSLGTRPSEKLPFGSAPNALALTSDGKRLYVANGGNNSVAVIDTRGDGKILGHLPVGWFPSALALDQTRGWLHVANIKGVGALHPPTGQSGFNSNDSLGSVSMITDLSEPALKKGSATVGVANRHAEADERLRAPNPDAAAVPIPVRHGEPSVFKHVVYIIKENRTYDQLLGDNPRGNGDPSLCIFGKEVTPNHHEIADEFVLLDNFNCGGIRSADGHNWTDEAFTTDYVEKMLGLFVRSHGNDPLAFASSGFIWDNALRHGRTFRCYGEMVQTTISPLGTFKDIYASLTSGAGKFRMRNKSHIRAISKNMCPTYPGYHPLVPDVYRAREFVKEFKQLDQLGKVPHLTLVFLPNDHISGTVPGLQTPAAAVADNDLALGRIVEAISRSSIWPRTCIFVVEDDPFSGWDHVDGHRTVALVVSPYTKRKAVISTRFTQAGMVKTIEMILGLPAMNQNDLFATPMTECFTAKPDYTPYTCRKNRIRVDETTAALDKLEGPARKDALASMKLDLDEVDEADEDTLNRILWRAMKGHDVPYPSRFVPRRRP